MGGHRRESADDDDTADGESQESSSASTKNQRWNDFMTSLKQPQQAATLPRSAGGTQTNGNARRDAVSTTRGHEERVERIAGMKREVDEKLQQIAAHSGKKYPTQPQESARSRAVPSRATNGGEVQPSVIGSRTRNTQRMQVDDYDEFAARSAPNGDGKKRSRKVSGRLAAESSSEEESSSNEEEAKRSPKKRKKDLERDDEMDIDSATMVTESVDSRSSRPSRVVNVRVKDKMVPVVPAVTRPGTARPVRSVTKKPSEPAIVPGVSTRSRGRREPTS